MKGEVRHERSREFRRWKRRVEISHRFQLVVAVGQEDYDLLRRLGHGSLRRGLQVALQQCRA